jgi:hypothetical protein
MSVSCEENVRMYGSDIKRSTAVTAGTVMTLTMII